MAQTRSNGKDAGSDPTAADAILEATRQLIAEGGVDAFSISDVARRAAVSRTLIYHYFNNRDNLILEAIRYVVHETADLRPALNEDAIERSARLHIEHPELGRFFFQLLLSGRSVPSLNRPVMAAIEALEQFKREHASASDLDPAMAIIQANLAQMAWGFCREEIAHNLGISVEEADRRWIAQLRRAARVGMEMLRAEGKQAG